MHPARIPYDDTTLPGYLIPAPGAAGQKRPTIIFTNGYDATITDLFFASAVAAGARGYHCLLFDGPAGRDAVPPRHAHAPGLGARHYAGSSIGR